MESLLLEPNLFVWLGLFVGACLGSFLNVVVYRAPRDLSVIRPASRCPHCSARIPWSQNLPILGWLFLKGRAKCCGNKILPQVFLGRIIHGSYLCLGMLCVYPKSRLGNVACFLQFCLVDDWSCGSRYRDHADS